MSHSVTESTIFLGFDIGKSEHAFAFVNAVGEVVHRGKLKTDKRSLKSFVSKAQKTHSDLVVGVEATGIYHERLARTFLDAGITVQVLNPQLTTTKAIRSSVRLVKSDAADAMGIAQKLREKRGDIGHPFSWNHERRALQALGRSYDHLLWHRQSLRAHVGMYKERGFAETFAPNPESLEPEISRLRRDLIAEARRVYPVEFEILVAVPGIADETAARMLAETMGIERFRNAHAFAAFVGVDPRVKESGTSVRGKTSMTKNGSPILRYLFGWTGRNVAQWSAPFRQRLDYDIGRGKPAGVAYGSIARRLAVVLYTCLVNKTPFDPSLVGAAAGRLT